jgi:membrane protein implicated in regulation of membrane protease activity
MDLFEWPAVAWVAFAILAGIVELATPHFGFLFVAVAALVAAVAGGLGWGAAVQLIVFAVALVLSLVLLRPSLTARLRSRGVPSRTDTLIGRAAIVTQDIDSTLGTGRINVGGEDWAARSGERLPEGTRVRVAAADGIVLEVIRA